MRAVSSQRLRRLIALGLGVVLSLVVAGCGTTARATVSVMTRNVYLGGNIYGPVGSALRLTGTEAVLALGRADHALLAVVQRTDFTVRSRLLAAEFAAARPDLIGLQEVALWRHGPLQPTIGPPTASVVDQDFLAMLLAATEATGVRYDVVRSQEEADVQAPAFADSPTEPGAQDVRLTQRDVILRRHDSSVQIEASGSAHYAQRVQLDLAGRHFAFTRGFAWADVNSGAARFRFVTTHLESASRLYAVAQANELVEGPVQAGRPVIVVCDCNSPPGSAAYEVLRLSGLVDAWTSVHGQDAGLTGVLSQTVNDRQPRFSRRLDLVLTRRTPAHPIGVTAAQIVGNQPADRDPATGLWPSDHAGLVVTLTVG